MQCQVAATGAAHERHPLRVDIELIGLLAHPANSFGDIEYGSGMAGHAAVTEVDGHDNESGGGHRGAVALAEGPVSQRPRTAMDVDDCSTVAQLACLLRGLVDSRQ